MEIGIKIYLQKLNGSKEETYYCKVIEKKGNHLFIDYPVCNQTNKTISFPEETKLKVTFIGKDNVLYTFQTKVIAKVKLRIPALLIGIPEKEEMQTIQRREFVRVEEAIDIAVHSPSKSFNPFITVSVDISGGGLAFIIPNDSKLEVNEIIHTWIVLPMRMGKHHYLKLEAKVIRLNDEQGRKKTCSVKFINIEKQIQQLIIYFCFEKLREARNKEVL